MEKLSWLGKTAKGVFIHEVARRLMFRREHWAGTPDDKVWRYLVYLKYWTLNLRPLMVYPEVLFPPNFVILRRHQGIWKPVA